MAKKSLKSRREFLKTTAAGGAGLILSDSVVNTVLGGEQKTVTRGVEINPKINNLRVVYVEDSTMLANGTSTTFGTFSAANTKVNADKVKANMDKMACALANEADIKKAWETIFQKPAAKNWADVLIAIKPNCAAGSTDGQSYPHAVIPIINAVCNVLIGFGAKGSNMTIYDTNGFSVNPSTLYPASSMVSGIKFLGPTSRNYPVPLGSTISSAAITADIIINIASNKGHSALGGATLTMKNHLGTVGGHVTTVQPILDIHNSEAVLGKPPFSTTNPPKQQLAIVDCLWTAKSGPTAAPDKAPCMIVMGTCCPAVDCFTAIKLRSEKFAYGGTRATFISYLTLYGYNATTDVEPLLKTPSPEPDSQGRAWLDANKWTPTNILKQNSSIQGTIINFNVSGSNFKNITKKISFGKLENIKSIAITDIKGRVIQNLAFNETDKNIIHWNARNQQGRLVGAGAYFLKITGTKTEKAVRFTLQK